MATIAERLKQLSSVISSGDATGANFGVLSPQEDALRAPSPVANVISGMARGAAELPKKVIEASENRRLGGDYDPSPAVEVALNLAGTGMPFAAKGAAGVFGGRLAKGADTAALKRAEEATAAGADRGTVWADTGWYQGPDSKWKFEIPDQAASLREVDWGVKSRIAGHKPKPLDEVLDHPTLYENYPDMRKMEVHHHADPASGAWYTEAPKDPTYIGSESIYIDMGGAGSRDQLLHELQHAIQKREGFAAGAAPGRTDFGGAASPLAVADNPIDMLPAVRAAEERAYAAYEKMYPTWMSSLKARTPEQQAAIEAEFGPIYEAAQKEANAARFSAYRASPGEVEARTVSNRSMMGHNSRRGIAPWERAD